MIDSFQKMVFDRRSALVIGGFGVLTSILVLQMFNLQVFNNRKYRKLSQNNTYRIKIEFPKRGIIYSSDGNELARDEQVYRLYVIPKDMNNFDSSISFLERSLGLNRKNINRIYKIRARQRDFQPILIKEKVDWKKMAELSAMNLPGIHIEQGFMRRYPNGSMASHILGYMAEPKDSLIPFFKTGKSGLERMYNHVLMGRNGRTVNVVNAEGRTIGEDTDQKVNAVPGKPIKTTIVKSIQQKLETELSKLQSGCGVVMNAETGDIIAMASVPSFNADLFGDENGDDYIDELSKNSKKPFMNKALDGLYPPGSVFKIIVAMAGLESGAIKPSEKIFCSGSWEYGNHLYHCWEKKGHGSVDLMGALKHSCDIYFYQVSLRIGIEAINLMAKKLGLGKPAFTNYDESEKVGVIPNREWKESNIGAQWVHGDTIITSIGQGFVLSNCLQLAVMLGAAMTNYKVKPRLTYDKKIEQENMGFQSQSISEISKGLQAVLEKGGTASGSYVNVNGQTMGGKTGTSQVRRISLEERSEGIRADSDLPWDLRNHGLFVGYAPANKPKYVISVIAEHVGTSSPVAHVASDVMKDLLNAKF